MSKIIKANAEHIELGQETLHQVSGGGFLRGELYQAIQTGGVQAAQSFTSNNTEAATSAIICDDKLITQTYFCVKAG
jgi:hypothetical protein